MRRSKDGLLALPRTDRARTRSPRPPVGVAHATRRASHAACEALIASLKTIYDDAERHYDLYLLLEDFIEFDERFLLWRGRHVRMVERMIGLKPGTGGSLGVAYLEKTLSKKFFPELWEVRTHLGASRPYGVLSEDAATGPDFDPAKS